MAKIAETAKNPYQEPQVIDYGTVAELTKKPGAKKPYHEPQVIDYGTVAELTKKPGSRTDGTAGTKGDKGLGA